MMLRPPPPVVLLPWDSTGCVVFRRILAGSWRGGAVWVTVCGGAVALCASFVMSLPPPPLLLLMACVAVPRASQEWDRAQ